MRLQDFGNGRPRQHRIGRRLSAGYDVLGNRHVVDPQPLMEDGFEGVRIRPMSNVVQQRRGRNQRGLRVVEPKVAADAACGVADPQRVLKPGVVRTGEDEVRQA